MGPGTPTMNWVLQYKCNDEWLTEVKAYPGCPGLCGYVGCGWCSHGVPTAGWNLPPGTVSLPPDHLRPV